jgi:hypothetical protein
MIRKASPPVGDNTSPSYPAHSPMLRHFTSEDVLTRNEKSLFFKIYIIFTFLFYEPKITISLKISEL